MEPKVGIRGIAPAVLAVALLALSLLPMPALAADEGAQDPVADESDDWESPPVLISTSSGPADVPDVKEVIQGKYPGEGFGGQTAGIGDVNGDGYDDFGVLVPFRGHMMVFHGGHVLTEATIHPMEGTEFTLSAQSQVRPAGDLDFDGFDDVLITAPGLYRGSLRAAGGVFIFYGSPAGLKELPEQMILGDEEDLRLGSDVDAIGDFNRDGYNDIIVGADGWNEDTGAVFLYMGGPNGLDTEPTWVWYGEEKGDRFGYSVTGAGDLNADGWLDFAVGAPFATTDDGLQEGKVYIFYGLANIGALDVGTTIFGRMLKSYFGLSIRLAGDVNNDGFSDLLISAPHEDGGHLSAGSVELFLGSEQGIDPYNPKWTFKGESPSALLGFTIAFLGDVNRDGYDDVAIGAPFHKEDEDAELGKVYIFFGKKSGFKNVPSMVEVGQHAGDRLSTGLAGAGDVDGDGFNDVLVGAPGADTGNGVDVGELHLYRGSDITMPPLQADAFSMPDAEDGDNVLAEYGHYLFRTEVTHRTGYEAIDHIDIHLDPEGEDVVFRLNRETETLFEIRDPNDLAEGHFQQSPLSGTYLDTWNISMEIKLHWDFPAGRKLSVRMEATDIHGLRTTGRWTDVATVIDKLTFSDEVHVSTSEQGVLESGDWVSRSAAITFSGATVEYDLSDLEVADGTHYYPPSGSFLLVVRDDLGGEWFQSITRQEEFNIQVIAPAISRPDMTYTISIVTPDQQKVFRSEQFVLNVDGTEVTFRNPEPSGTIANREGLASIEIEDPLGPGVEPSSVYYQIDLAGDDQGFGRWKQADVSPGPGSDSSVVAEAFELFTEGVNYIRWRAYDEVGNGPTVSFIYPITVDLGSITFLSAIPDSGQWHNTRAVGVGITIENTQGNKIDLDRIEFRSSTSPGVYSEWEAVAAGGDPTRVTVTANLQLDEGDDNYVQWRAMDVEAREPVSSPLYRILIDLTGPVFSGVLPSEESFIGSREVLLTVMVQDDLSGVLEDTIQYQIVGEDEWYKPDSQTYRSGAIECTAQVLLREGVDNYIHWQARDAVGHLSQSFDQHIEIDLTPPVFSDFTPGPGEVVTTQYIEVSVRIEDGDNLDLNSGVDLSTIEFAISRPSTGGYGPWTKPIIHSNTDIVPFYIVTVIVEVDNGDQNFIIWRAADASVVLDPDGERKFAVSEPVRIVADLPDNNLDRPPQIILTEPEVPKADFGQVVVFDARDSRDPARGNLTFLWMSDIDGLLGSSASFSRHLSKGLHTITLTVRSTASGLSAEHEFQLNVEAQDDGAKPLSSIWEQMAVILIGLFVVVTLLLQHFRIKEY